MAALMDIAKLYRQHRLIPFLGAGASMAVSWKLPDGTEKRGPSWLELVKEAARILDFDPPALLLSRGDYLQVLEYFLVKKGLEPLSNHLVIETNAPNDVLETSPLHSQLAAMKNFDTYYTTNFDFFLERSLELNGRKVRVIAKEADLANRRQDCDVVKFHGDLNNLEQMVLTESQYQKRLAFESPMDLRLRSDSLGKAFLFIGYSFRDSNVSYLFHLLNERLHSLPGTSTGRRGFILVEDPSNFEYTLFDRRNIEVIPISRLDRENEIISVLKGIAEI